MITEPEAKEREYEAVATVRDILLILYSEMNESIGRDCPYLFDAYQHLAGLADMAAEDMVQ